MFTKHEMIFLGLVVILLIVFGLFPSLLTETNELLFMIFIVLPLGILIITDKERMALLQNDRHEQPNPQRPPGEPS